MKRLSKNADEIDILYRYWRRQLGYNRRAGVCDRIKTRMRRSERRQARLDIQRDTW